jgi:hypothetical protein
VRWILANRWHDISTSRLDFVKIGRIDKLTGDFSLRLAEGHSRCATKKFIACKGATPMSKKLFGLMAVVLCCAGSAKAGPQFNFDFQSPAGDAGHSHQYTFGSGSSTLTITATAYLKTGDTGTLHLYDKTAADNLDPLEHGLGIAGAPHSEIQTTNFIQLDLNDSSTGLINKGATQLQLQITSIQSGEGFDLYKATTAGSLGTLLPGYIASSNQNPFVIPIGTYRYLNIDASSFDVLLHGFSSPTPEPSTVVLLTCIGIPVGGYGWYKRRRQSRQPLVAA